MAASLLREAGVLGPFVVKCVSSKAILGATQRCLCRLKVHHLRRNYTQTVRLAAAATSSTDAAPTANKSEVSAPVKTAVLETQASEDLNRERYIPITRRPIIRFLMKEDNFLNDGEKKKFEDFALSLDSAIVNKYHIILQDLKLLFDPINPDKDTVPSRQVSRGEKLDNEFWLLQRLEDVMDKANFQELDKARVGALLAEHESEGVRVSVNPERYDVLRFWVLGREQPPPTPGLLARIINRLLKRPTLPTVEFYKRVVVAIRLKKDAKLVLKSFKEIPVNHLEMLLPDGTLQMSTVDRSLIYSCIFVASTGVLAKIVTVLAGMHLDWMLLLTLVTGGVGVRAWTAYKNRRSAYLVNVSRTLYFNNLANNMGLLASLVDRAEDESFKEALLTYSFLLTLRDGATHGKASSKQVPAELGGLTDAALESKVEDWIEKKTGVHIEFESSEAVELLKKFGLLSEANGKLNVLPLAAALNCLPITPQSLIARSMEADLPEGYDRDEYLETENLYKEEEERNKKYGWF